ncbi:MAG: alpha/beta hydrolase [Akkermansiaceae bacterium]|jgi:acetyl esterase/lipase
MMRIPSLLAIALSGSLLSAEPLKLPDAIPLWENGAPGSEARADEAEKIEASEDGEKFNVSNVHNPSITPFLPAPDKATGAAVLIAPGGGHRKLCLGHEGWALGQWLSEQGIAAFVMKNRLARDVDSTYTIQDHAMADTRRALRLIRSRAAEWQIDSARLGVMGFSAGGELAAFASMEFDSGKADAADPIEREGSRPAFQGLIYPGTSNLFSPSPKSPPLFIACGYHDRDDIASGMADLYLKYKKAGIPAELHIYSNAGHGFGFRPEKTNSSGKWAVRFIEWLDDSGFLKKS